MLRTLLGATLLLALPSLAAADVRVDFNRANDFTRYRTFAVEIGPIVRSDGSRDERNALAEDRLHYAVGRELRARGLALTEIGADIIVRVSNRDMERTEIVSSGFGPYRRYWGRYRYWGAPYYSDIWARRYLEGSMTVDVIERETGRLVYRAQVTDEVGNDLDKHAIKAMEKAFKKYPVKELVK